MLNTKSDIVSLFEYARKKAPESKVIYDDISFFKLIINIIEKFQSKDFLPSFSLNYEMSSISDTDIERFCQLRLLYKFYNCSKKVFLTKEEQEFIEYYKLSEDQEEIVLKFSGYYDN